MRINNCTPPFEKNLISAAICVGLLAVTPNAQALILTADTLVTIPSNSSSNTDSGSNFAGSSSFLSDTDGMGQARANGNDAGWMYSNSRGDGIFTAQSTIQQSVEFTNTTGSIQNYFFDFTISFGSLSSIAYIPLVNDDFTTAGNEVSITLNGAEIFNSAAELTTNTSGANLITDGLVLGSYSPGSDSYNWGEYSDTLNLGTIGIGETFTLEYDITTFASSNIPYSECAGFDYGEGYGIAEGFGEGNGGSAVSTCTNNFVKSQFGDPNGFSSVPINNNTVTSSAVAVSEPSALFLLGGGLAGLAYSRRRKQRNR